jgi:hypothetical protein
LAEPANRDTTWEKKSPFALNVSADVTAPPVALFNTGSALGYRSTEVLKAHVKAIATDGGASHYAHFRLTDKREPMSWVMSKKAVRLLDDEWARNSAPYSDLAQFVGWKQALSTAHWIDSPGPSNLLVQAGFGVAPKGPDRLRARIAEKVPM